MMYKFVLSITLLLVTACGDQVSSIGESDASRINALFESGSAIDVAQRDMVMEKWSRSCALCHVNGEGGAPIMGDAEAWSPRLARGKVELYVHTIEGFNRMPPLGYCMDCEDKDFVVMIEMMSGANK